MNWSKAGKAFIKRNADRFDFVPPRGVLRKCYTCADLIANICNEVSFDRGGPKKLNLFVGVGGEQSRSIWFKYPVTAMPPEEAVLALVGNMTDEGDVAWFVACVNGRLRYSAKGKKWARFDGTSWYEGCEPERWTLEVIDLMCEAAKDYTGPHRAAFLEHVRTLGSGTVMRKLLRGVKAAFALGFENGSAR